MKNIKTPNLVSVLILTLITVVMWILFSVYRAFTTEAPPNVPQEITEPLVPSLDEEAIAQIQIKTFYDDSQIPNLTFSPIQLTPTVTAPPTATAPPEQIATSSATPATEPTSSPLPEGDQI